MKSEVSYTLNKLETAYQRLKESTEQAIDELDRDGVIKRFEFSFELFWKALKILLKHEGFDCTCPRSCIREGARRGLLKKGEAALDMLEDKIETSHIYDELTAKKIFERIKYQHVKTMEENINYFNNILLNQTSIFT